MVHFSLVQTTTPDGLIHQGISVVPPGSKRGIVWVHGLTGTFYGNVSVVNTLAETCVANGLAFASFNTRGHDGITSIKKIDTTSEKGYTYVNAGAGYEDFVGCIDDIRGGVDYFEQQGIKEVILVGHSTGANKVSYTLSEYSDERILGAVLIAGLSDKLIPDVDTSELKNDIEMMKLLVDSGKGDGLVVGKIFFPITPKRFLSLYTPGPEDQFDYGEKRPKFPYFSTITKPICVIIGEKDEYLDREANSFLHIFETHTKSSSFKGAIITDADHSFKDKEKELADTVATWCVSL